MDHLTELCGMTEQQRVAFCVITLLLHLTRIAPEDRRSAIADALAIVQDAIPMPPRG